ncbi:MAG TPA: hypothetical protein VFA33_07590 [Bryobacteraceae bacterium]|nr:hypothetical protein [Bryobacteraceae bacterium]
MPFGGLLAAGISAGTSIFGGLLGSSASKKAAQQLADKGIQAGRNVQQAGAEAQGGMDRAVSAAAGDVNAGADRAIQDVWSGTDRANATLSDVYAQQQANLNPYLAAGQQGVTSLASMLAPGGALSKEFSFNPADLKNEPGYQFTLQQGTRALQNAASARGGASGSSSLKALTRFSQGLADTTYQNAYNRALTTFQTNRNNTLAGMLDLANLGQFGTQQFNATSTNFGNQTAANTLNAGLFSGNTRYNAANRVGDIGLTGAEYNGNLGLRTAEDVGNDLMGVGNAQAAGTVGAANAWQTALGGVANAAQTYGLSRMLNPYGSGTVGAYVPNPGYGGAPPAVMDQVIASTPAASLLPPPAVNPDPYNYYGLTHP